MKSFLPVLPVLMGLLPFPAHQNKALIFKNATIIDGTGRSVLEHADLRTENGTIIEVGKNLDTSNVKVIDLSGKTIMPELVSTHMHIGTLKGTQNKPENYTRENIIGQLSRYESFGVGNVLVMGSDRPMLFDSGLRDSSLAGLLPGARLYSAGYGFGVPQNAPPADMAMDVVFRPSTPQEVSPMMEQLAGIRPAVVKMWVDDFGGKFKKMDPAISREIIRQAHQRQLRVASHLYYLSDARRLVADGLDIIAHSIRDSIIDDALLLEMRKRNVTYIPTLSLDEFAFIYARRADWIDDAFFKASLEPGVYEMITSEKYKNELINSPSFAKNKKAFETALVNLRRVFKAGIAVSMGTDSGATPIRAQGFSEHLELELMVQAGLTPLEAITVATKNGATLLKGSDSFGTLEKGKCACFIVLQKNPANDIRATRTLEAVYKNGVLVTEGPNK